MLVTSALPGEGKSTVAANLGRTAAMAGDNVLLIDADLRRPSLASALDIGGDHGLADVLTGRCALNTSVKRDRKSGSLCDRRRATCQRRGRARPAVVASDD